MTENIATPSDVKRRVVGADIDIFDVYFEGEEKPWSTFDGALGNTARTLIGTTCVVGRHEEDKAGKRRDGTPTVFKNRFLDSIRALDDAWAPTTAAAANSDPIPLATNDTELRIHRQTATKVAAWLMPFLPEEERTPTGLVHLADYFVSYYANGVTGPWDPDGPEPSASQPPARSAYDEPLFTTQYGNTGTSGVDDDIPF